MVERKRWSRKLRNIYHIFRRFIAKNLFQLNDKTPESTPLGLQNVGGVFLVLFVGTFFGFVGSLIELAVHILRRARNCKISFKEEFYSELRFFVQFKRHVKTTQISEEIAPNQDET